MKFGYSLLILATTAQVAVADTNMAERYTLPPGKTYIEPCRQEALLLHPGTIEKQRILHQHENFWVRHEIEAHDGSEWLVLCDLATGNIIREQKLVDEAL